MSVPGSAEQLTATNGSLRRVLASWSARATSSLPVPVSPRMSTVASGVGHAEHQAAHLVSTARDEPTIAPTPHDALDPLAQARHLAAQREPLAEALDDGQEHLGAELVLEHVVLRAAAHRLADLGELDERGHHDRRHGDPARAQLAQHLEAAAVARVRGQADVEQQEVGRRPLHGGERLVHRGSLADLDVRDRRAASGAGRAARCAGRRR